MVNLESRMMKWSWLILVYYTRSPFDNLKT
jgi:hypothetical protein